MTRRRRNQGTVSVEIVVMLPVMIVLYAAVYHFYALGRAELTTSQSARACAWQYALSGCEGRGSLCEGLGVTRGGEVEQKEANQSKDPEPEDTRYKRAKDSREPVFDKLEKVPVVRQITQFLFGEVASASASLKTKKFRSDEETRTSNEIYLVCNTVSESWGEKIKDSICSMIEKVIESKMPGCPPSDG
jgi:hypothetical protein